MSQNDPETLTHHAMLVVWGQFGHSLGLIDPMQSVVLHQKTVQHSPHTKVLEFLIAILAEEGMRTLQSSGRLSYDNYSQINTSDCKWRTHLLFELDHKHLTIFQHYFHLPFLFLLCFSL